MTQGHGYDKEALSKRLHRMAMERLLPPGISKRPKHCFSTPYDDWLRASLGSEVEHDFRLRLVEQARRVGHVREVELGPPRHGDVVAVGLEAFD